MTSSRVIGEPDGRAIRHTPVQITANVRNGWQIDDDHLWSSTDVTCGRCIRAIPDADCTRLFGLVHDAPARLCAAAHHLDMTRAGAEHESTIRRTPSPCVDSSD